MRKDPWQSARDEFERVQRYFMAETERSLREFRATMEEARSKHLAERKRLEAEFYAARDSFHRTFGKRPPRRPGRDGGIGSPPDAPEPLDRGPRRPNTLSGGAAVTLDSADE